MPEMIRMIFECLEEKHGEKLVFRALSSVTAARYGLSEILLEDLLCLDDELLEDVYVACPPSHMCFAIGCVILCLFNF